MGETAQPQPERIRRLTGNRSAESVNRSIGHIARLLNKRARKLPEGESLIKGSKLISFRDTEYKAEHNNGSDHLEVRTWSDNKGDARSNEIDVEYNRYQGLGGLKVSTTPEGVEAEFTPLGANHEDKRVIADPSMVADVAASALNKLRGHVAEAELAAQRKDADAKRAVKQEMIDFVTDKKD